MMELRFEAVMDRIRTFRFPTVDLVVGIGRGGMVPAVLIAQHLGKDIEFLRMNFRDDQNQPCRKQPVLLKSLPAFAKRRRILLVDDVAVTGQTLKMAKAVLRDHAVKTLVIKGQAEYVLFPEIKDCVNWPWAVKASPQRKSRKIKIGSK